MFQTFIITLCSVMGLVSGASNLYVRFWLQQPRLKDFDGKKYKQL